ncbi:MAG: hypothetical protein N2749_01010 [Clostridia bacterium]|nr:hypothetical protein [Clostridia bacterium]
MSVAKKDRFVKTNLKEIVESGQIFPPEKINYEDKRLTLLGISNKNDLAPVTIDSYDLQRAATFGEMGQFVYVNENGDFYDLFLYQDEIKQTILYGIRTRQLPDKTK